MFNADKEVITAVMEWFFFIGGEMKKKKNLFSGMTNICTKMKIIQKIR